MRFKQRRKTNHHSSKPRPQAPPAEAAPGPATATPPTPTPPSDAPTAPEQAPSCGNLSLCSCGPVGPHPFTSQMLAILAERRRGLNCLVSTIYHPTTPLKLKLYCIKSISKIPYYRFRKRDHTDPSLAGYRPQYKAFNRELLDTTLTTRKNMYDWLEKADLPEHVRIAAYAELVKLPFPKVRMEDHCDDDVPPYSRQPQSPTQSQTQSQSQSEHKTPRQAPNSPALEDLENLDLNDLSESEIVQIVQNVQNALPKDQATNSGVHDKLTPATC